MIGATLLNRYRIDAELGQGGMGMVYRAHDTLLNRPVAVKVLSSTGLGTAGRARLLAEARAAAKLNHPNIVTIHDAGEADPDPAGGAGGAPFIVMELVEGSSLRNQLPTTLAESLAIAWQVCAALEHAHGHGIIHRDLKPENVVLTRTQTAKLMDFGLARSADASAPQLTEEGAIVGTFTYLAPELLLGQPASAQSDLYALGVMLYELTTGRPPFTGDNLAALVAQHLQAEPASPREHNPEISSDLDALILSLLHKQPADRPASAAEVAQALGQMTPTPVLSSLLSSRAAAPMTNLPTQLSKFVGREKEITQLKKRVAEYRLVTLTGSGGVGKTRLSIQLASELLNEFPHGAWLVELAPLTDPALVPQTAAAVLDVKPQGNQPVLNALADYLRAKKLLLMLDNCEHLIEACAQLAEALLRACPDLRLLATSREALGVEGEVVARVPSLSLPSPQTATLAAIAEAEAVQLFVERASAALPSFALTESNAPLIAQVCRRLDGIALAIELAASRVKLLKVEQIAARLDDAFRFLTGGSRTALPRQQTLRAAIDWSYNLLSEMESLLLRCLSVFAGGWTLEASEAVCAGEGIEPYEILDLLTQLVNKSLVTAEREQGEEARYRMLETIREYALERLAKSGETEGLRGRHVSFFMRLAEEAEPELRGPNQRIWLERLDTEHDNFRAALGWSLETNTEAGGQLAGNLMWFWHTLCYWSEGREWYARLLTSGTALQGQRPLSVAARAQALCEAGWLAMNDLEIDQALALSEEGLTLYRELGDKAGSAMALHTLGWVAYYLNDYDRASVLADESLVLYRELGSKWRMAHLLNLLGTIARGRGDYEPATEFYRESLKWAREIGDIQGIAYSLFVWGYMAWLQGNLEQAATLIEESLPLAREIRLEWSVAESLNTLGDIARAQGDYARASAFYDESQVLWERLGNKRDIGSLFLSQGWLARLQGEYQSAAKLFGEGLRMWQEVGDKRRIAACLEGLAGVAVALGMVDRVVRLFGAAEVLREVAASPLLLVNRANYDRDIIAARAQLDEAAFNAAWAEGQAMTMEQAIEYALATDG